MLVLVLLALTAVAAGLLYMVWDEWRLKRAADAMVGSEGVEEHMLAFAKPEVDKYEAMRDTLADAWEAANKTVIDDAAAIIDPATSWLRTLPPDKNTQMRVQLLRRSLANMPRYLYVHENYRAKNRMFHKGLINSAQFEVFERVRAYIHHFNTHVCCRSWPTHQPAS
eukprot:GHVU01142416.1.p2 GENE.GHVU01142416.1~~GHVU01142416.1.p2  ORF type:complete len:167 (+),score=38.16 GHVU01142416.1:672-1172(+)